MAETPQAVKDVLEKLEPSDKGKILTTGAMAFLWLPAARPARTSSFNRIFLLTNLDLVFVAALQAYIDELRSTIKNKDKELAELNGTAAGGDDVDEDEDMPPLEEADDDNNAEAAAAPDDDEADFPPLYESGEDYDKAADAKQQAADLKSSGDWEKALEQYNIAVQAAPPSALLYANRAIALMKLDRMKAALRDCNLALKENPDSAKALRVRGKVNKELGNYEEALKDLSASQAIDFDEGTVEDLKFLTEQHVKKEKEHAERRNTEQEKLRKRAEEIKQAQEEAKREAEKERAERASMGGGGGMPNMGGMPGMGGMGGGEWFISCFRKSVLYVRAILFSCFVFPFNVGSQYSLFVSTPSHFMIGY